MCFNFTKVVSKMPRVVILEDLFVTHFNGWLIPLTRKGFASEAFGHSQ